MRALIVIMVVGGTSLAAADAKHDQAAVAQLDAAYQPSARLAGADRTKQACADAAKLQTVAAALPVEHAPAGAAVDDTGWKLAASGLGSQLEDLVAVCKAPDHKLKHIGDRVETADEIVASIDGHVHAVLDAAKPRDVPPALKKLRTTLAAMRAASKRVCTQEKQLGKLAAGLATPPSGADAAKWQAAAAELTAALAELKQFACGSPRGADEEIAGSLEQVHEASGKLVLASPAH